MGAVLSVRNLNGLTKYYSKILDAKVYLRLQPSEERDKSWQNLFAMYWEGEAKLRYMNKRTYLATQISPKDDEKGISENVCFKALKPRGGRPRK